MHIAVMSHVQEQIHAVERRSTLVGFDFFGFRAKLQAEVKTPRTKAQVLELLRTEGEKTGGLPRLLSHCGWITGYPDKTG